MIYLIGAGPGAADLITVRGANILARADVVFYDALVSAETLGLATKAIEKIAVGKRCGQHSIRQSEINQKLIQAASQFAIVVRLKGGDPTLFARADEEINALVGANIDFEIIPGISAAFAAAAELKVPLTARGKSRQLVLSTLRLAQDEPSISVQATHSENPTIIDSIASANELPTQVFYMARGQLISLAKHAFAQGYPHNTPVCVMSQISTARQQKTYLILSQLLTNDIIFQDDEAVLILLGTVFSPLTASNQKI